MVVGATWLPALLTEDVSGMGKLDASQLPYLAGTLTGCDATTEGHAQRPVEGEGRLAVDPLLPLFGA